MNQCEKEKKTIENKGRMQDIIHRRFKSMKQKTELEFSFSSNDRF